MAYHDPFLVSQAPMLERTEGDNAAMARINEASTDTIPSPEYPIPIPEYPIPDSNLAPIQTRRVPHLPLYHSLF